MKYSRFSLEHHIQIYVCNYMYMDNFFSLLQLSLKKKGEYKNYFYIYFSIAFLIIFSVMRLFYI